MKNILILLSLIVCISLISCKKDDTTKPKLTVEEPKELSIYGEWLLIGGDMYMENMETHVKTSYHHFNTTKTVSSTRYEGSLFPIEIIENNKTTWAIYPPNMVPGNGVFILNSDTLNQYGFHVTTSNWTIIESPLTGKTQMGGGSRPISATIVDYDEKIGEFTIEEGTTSIKNQNYTYFNVLRLKKTKEW